MPDTMHSRVTGALLACGTVLLFLWEPGDAWPLSVQRLWDCGHLIYFALFSLALLQIPAITRATPGQRWLAVLAISLLAGALIEVLQLYTHRDASLDDVGRDVAGSLLLLAYSPGPGIPARPRILLRTAAAILLLILLSPLARSLVDETIARQQFPLLAGFETPFELERWKPQPGLRITSLPDRATDHVLDIPLTTTHYSGIELDYFPRDWRSYNYLQFDMYNPESAPLWITCRIHDEEHEQGTQDHDDRYNLRFRLEAGWNHIGIDLQDVAGAPAQRTMDMARIRAIGFFATDLPHPRRIYLDNLRLSVRNDAGAAAAQ